MKYTLIAFLFIVQYGISQDNSQLLTQLKSDHTEQSKQLSYLQSKIDSVTLLVDMETLVSLGLPSDNYLKYRGFYLEYSEEHEQALWTMHIINPNIVNLGVGRTNDFRVDPRIKTATADSIDYFEYDSVNDEYNGYGFDRGHLVPSADFRWNVQAMSETYFYSNISPQRPEFNREVWANIEGHLRKFVMNNTKRLVVVNIPIFEGSTKIEQSINGVSIPTSFAKVVLDPESKKTVGFLLKNEGTDSDLATHAVSVDTIEELTGYDLFAHGEVNEGSVDEEYWFPDYEADPEPISQNNMPRGYFNTQSAPNQVGSNKQIWVCGTCVAGRKSRAGNLWLNLDKKYPNSPVSAMIKKENLGHFEYDIIEAFVDKKVCVRGVMKDFGSGANLEIVNSHHIELYQAK